ncbi:hypothetical protein DR864_12035 [Runella rosea]|uniref:Uncharacterized protein n=1 Tax=Runella rosea TaxID=2259595 RepID=A0A344TIF7_9BACT|nr:hypothetical protein DR864_12035 [Runella rosea]
MQKPQNFRDKTPILGIELRFDLFIITTARGVLSSRVKVLVFFKKMRKCGCARCLIDAMQQYT